MPRIETFLISSVLLSCRQAAARTVQMLKHSRTLVERREARKGWRRLYLPRKISWKKWLVLAGEDDAMTLPQNARKDVRTGKGSQSTPNDADDDDEYDDVAKRNGTAMNVKPPSRSGAQDEARHVPTPATSPPATSAPEKPQVKPEAASKSARANQKEEVAQT